MSAELGTRVDKTVVEVQPKAEEVFRRGNLVFGGSLRKLPSYTTLGIRTPNGLKALGIPSSPLDSEDDICFALMGNRPLPKRYQDAMHYGPRGLLSVHDLGIVVSREALMQAYPGQVLAIGLDFYTAFDAHPGKRWE